MRCQIKEFIFLAILSMISTTRLTIKSTTCDCTQFYNSIARSCIKKSPDKTTCDNNIQCISEICDLGKKKCKGGQQSKCACNQYWDSISRQCLLKGSNHILCSDNVECKSGRCEVKSQSSKTKWCIGG
jgi:hypothetical protein